jgi:chromosome partitioning protein
MTTVIAICQQKGGVAKTTTALSLGACFAEQHIDTLLIDLDSQANLTVGLGLNPANIRRSAADVLLGDSPIVHVTRESVLPGLDLVPSNPDMLTAAKALNLRTDYEYLLREALHDERIKYYEVVIIDCPPTLGSLTLSALTAAELVIIPVPCEYFAVQGLKGVLKLIKLVRERTNPQLHYRLLVTMFDRRGNLHSNMLEQIKEHFSDSMLDTMIGVDSKLRESQVVGVPIIMHSPWTRGTQQYRALAEEVLTNV